jgi:hypothetical protein
MKQTRTEAAAGRSNARQAVDTELTPAEREATIHGMVTAVVMGHLICLIVYSPYWVR